MRDFTVPLRQQLSSGPVLRVMGCCTPLGARVAEQAGFEAVWFSGFELATANCVPDASVLTMTDHLSALRAITYSINVPVIADSDSGFGGLNNVIHMVKEYERFGVAAVCIEDKLFPKTNSLAGKEHPLIAKKEFAAKIRAAVHTRLSKNFLFIARRESFIAGMG